MLDDEFNIKIVRITMWQGCEETKEKWDLNKNVSMIYALNEQEFEY